MVNVGYHMATTRGIGCQLYSGGVSNRNRLLAIVAAVLVIALVIAGSFLLNRRDGDSSDIAASPAVSEPAPEPSSDPAEPDPSDSLEPAASPTASASATAAAGFECTTATEGFVPVRYTFEGNLPVDETVISVGEDEDGNIGAPPPAEKRTAAWWENGPLPGPTEGKTVLSIHTYRNGGALGNEMYEGGKSQLKDGDVIKLHGANGEVACYEFADAQRVMVDEYDPDSDVMVDFEGDSEVVIIICWDFDPNANEEAGEDPWESRVFFHGKLF